jgi:hypothetical protein
MEGTMLTPNENNHNQKAQELRQQMKQARGNDQQNTGKDLIAFFRNSPLAEVAIELERDKSRSRTIAL